MEPSLISSEIQFLTLLTIAAGIAMAVKYVRLPYTIALVIGGLLISLTAVRPYHLTEEMILFIFLPPLLFEGAIHFELTDLRRNFRSIGALAFPGLIVSGFLAGYMIQRLTGLPLAVALLVGVMITPTDPISVLALFKKLGVSRRLSMVVEGESVFNDGTGIVLYSVLVGIVTSGTFNFGSSVLIGYDDANRELKKPTKEYMTQLLIKAMQRKRILFPDNDLDIEHEFLTHTYSLNNGRIVYSKGNDHIIDSARCAFLARDQQLTGVIEKPEVSKTKIITNIPLPVATNPIFD